MDHVGKPRWYGPKYQKNISNISNWQKLLNRRDDFKVSMSIEVCSKSRYRPDQCTTPTLFLKGYTHLQ